MRGLWRRRDLRQGFPISSVLFSVYIVDVEEYMKKEQNGGALMSRKKFMTLAYAYDLALVTKQKRRF